MHDMICRQIEAAHHTSTTSNDRKERNIQWHTSENAVPSGITPSRSAAGPTSARKFLAALHARSRGSLYSCSCLARSQRRLRRTDEEDGRGVFRGVALRRCKYQYAQEYCPLLSLIFENHIRPAIGDRKLRSIRPQMLQQLLNDVKHLSYQTGADAYARCHALFQSMVRRNLRRGLHLSFHAPHARHPSA